MSSGRKDKHRITSCLSCSVLLLLGSHLGAHLPADLILLSVGLLSVPAQIFISNGPLTERQNDRGNIGERHRFRGPNEIAGLAALER